MSNLMYSTDSYVFNFTVWDIPGQLKNVDYSFRYCLGSTFIVYVFDFSDRKSFADLKDWMKETEICDNGEMISNPVLNREQVRFGKRS
jgi:hypothetical protein